MSVVDDQLREDRARYLAELASIEAGNESPVIRKEWGDPVEDPQPHVARLKQWIADIERFLAQNGERFDAQGS